MASARLQCRFVVVVLLAVFPFVHVLAFGKSWCYGQKLGDDSEISARLRVELIAEASAATRLTLSSGGRFAVAELRGSWIEEERLVSGRDVPPVVKLIDLRSPGDAAEPARRVVASVSGWAMGAPADDGDFLWIEKYGQEGRFRVRSLAWPATVAPLQPPPGVWTVKAALRWPAARHAVAILCSPVAGYAWLDSETRRERLWLASIDVDTLAIEATAALDVTTPWPALDPYRAGVAVGPAHVYVAALPEKSPAWRVLALDVATLERRWQVTVELADPGRFSEDAISRERASRHVLLGPSGDGSVIAVVYGRRRRVGVEISQLVTLDAGDGRALDRLVEPPGMATVHEVAAVPDEPAVALLQYAYDRQQGEYTTRLQGVVKIDLRQMKILARYELSPEFMGPAVFERMRWLLPASLAVAPDGTILLAPANYYWARRHAGDDVSWPTSEGRGAERPEVRGLVGHSTGTAF